MRREPAGASRASPRTSDGVVASVPDDATSGYAILWVLLFGHVTALARGTMPTRNLTAVVVRTEDHAIGDSAANAPTDGHVPNTCKDDRESW